MKYALGEQLYGSLGIAILALTARGLGTCVQLLVAGFPDVIRRTLAIPDHYHILC